MGLISWLRGDDLLAEEVQSRDLSIGDPALAEYFGIGGSSAAGIPVTESSSLGLTAVYRAVSLISGAVAGLPMKVYRKNSDGSRERVETTFLENPHGKTGMTRFEWQELVMVHLLLHGNAYLAHVYGGAGQLVALDPIHPSVVSVMRAETAEDRAMFGDYGKFFVVGMADGSQRKFSPEDLTHITGLGTDGLRGLSPIEAHRQTISCGLAGDRAAARMFGSGLLLAGLVSSDEELEEEDAKAALAGLKAKVAGADHAGDIAWINAAVKFTPWAMPARDAQFIESRVHQVEEVSRIYGVPPHLLGQTEKQTSWGTGVAEQNRGLHRYTLAQWTSRLEQRLSRLLTGPQFVEFDYSGFLQPAPEQEIPLLIQQVQAGLLTVNEARAIRNLPPLPAAAGEGGPAGAADPAPAGEPALNGAE